MSQQQLLQLVVVRLVVIVALDLPLDPIVADIVEALVGGALYILDVVIGHQEPLLPPHKDGVVLAKVVGAAARRVEVGLAVGLKVGKLLPMASVGFIGGLLRIYIYNSSSGQLSRGTHFLVWKLCFGPMSSPSKNVVSWG